MKMLAGAKLKHRKPSSAPSSKASEAATNHWPIDSAVPGTPSCKPRDAGAEAVHVVQEVEGVRDSSDP
jgi:hypothetical protein